MVKYKCQKCGGEVKPLKKDFQPLYAACIKCGEDHGYWVDVEAKTGVQTIFKGERGEVWKGAMGNYGSMGANHFLCVEMAREIERIRLIVDSTKAA